MCSRTVLLGLIGVLTINVVVGDVLTPSAAPIPPEQRDFVDGSEKQLGPALSDSSLLGQPSLSNSKKTCCKGTAEVCRYWVQSLFDGPIKGTHECMTLNQNNEQVCVENSGNACCVTGATAFGSNYLKKCYEKVQGTWCNAYCKTPAPPCPSPACPKSSCPDELPPGCCKNKAEICKINKKGQRRCIARPGTSKEGPPCFKITGSGRKKKCCLTGGAKKHFPRKNCYRASRRRDCTATCV